MASESYAPSLSGCHGDELACARGASYFTVSSVAWWYVHASVSLHVGFLICRYSVLYDVSICPTRRDGFTHTWTSFVDDGAVPILELVIRLLAHEMPDDVSSLQCELVVVLHSRDTICWNTELGLHDVAAGRLVQLVVPVPNADIFSAGLLPG